MTLVKTPYLFSRYLIQTFLNWLLVVALAVGSIVAIFDFTELFRRAATKSKIGVPLILKMLLLRFPTHIQELLPFVILFGAIMALWRLNRNNELIVMRSAGISIWQILSPMILLALSIGFFDLVFLGPYSAKLMSRFEVLEDKYLTDRAETISIVETGLWLREHHDQSERILRITRIDFNKKLLEKVTMYEFNAKNELVKRLDAENAILDQHILEMNNVWQSYPRAISEKLDHIKFATTLSLQNIQESSADPRTLPLWMLMYYADLMEQSGLSSQKYLLRWHSLISGCLWLGVMIILAATFSLNPARSKQTSLMFGIGVLSAFILYFFRDMTAALGLAGTIPSILAAWAPTLVTALFSITKLLYSEDG